MKKRFRRPVRTDDIGQVNRLFSYTVLFILMMSLIGIASLTKNYIASVFISQLGLVIPISMYLILNIGRVKEVISLRKINLPGACAAILMGFTITPFIGFVNQLSMVWAKNMTNVKAEEAAAKYPMLLMLLMAAIIPSIVEELTFRGVFFTAYKKKSVIGGAILSAILFGLMHGNLNQLAYALVAGFIFAMTDYAGGSFIYSILIHIVVNSITIVGLYYPSLMNKLEGIIYFSKEPSSLLAVISYMWLPAIIGLVLTMCMYYIIRTSSKKQFDSIINEENRIQTNRIYKNVSMVDAGLMVGVVIMLVNIVANEILG